MFLGLSTVTWISIASTAAVFVYHQRAAAGFPVIGGLLDALLGNTASASPAPAPMVAPITPVVNSAPVLVNHPVLNELMNLALKQFLAASANPSGSGSVVK